jgi:flavin reductase (DIM6/NTAB) family NADH-FMN oxidoreductase RutF
VLAEAARRNVVGVSSVPVPDEPVGVDPLGYRRAMGRFATGITVVTTCDAGVDHAMTVNSLASVSLDPLRLLFCCEKVARFHAAVSASGAWAVSVLGADQEPVARWFAKRGRPLESQFAGVPHRRGAASGALLLTDAIATVECRTVAAYDGGDHTIILGEILAVSMPRPQAPPLLHYDSGYHAGEGG